MNGVIKRVGMVFVTTMAAIAVVYLVNTGNVTTRTNSSTNDISLKTGEAYKLEVAETLDSTPTYESSNPEIAVVDTKTGIITAKSVGETKVTVKTEDEIVEYVVAVTEELTPTEEKPVIVNDEQDINNATITQVAEQLYTGYPLTPDIEVVIGEDKLENTVDYNITYGNNTDVGTATIQVTGIGKYKGTKVTTFEIYKIEQPEQPVEIVKTKAEITCKNPSYTGLNQVIASCNGGEVQNSSQKKVGDYKVTCIGDSTHLNADSKTCSITKGNLSNVEIASIADQKYTGKAITPKIVVTQGSVTLVKDTDYKVSYSNNTNVGTATITVTGINNYAGTKSITFRIVNQTQTKSKAVITCANKTYSGSTQTIATCSGGTVKNASQTKVGSYTVTCTGDSSHTNADNKTCNITAANVSSATVSTIANQTYTGKAITPTPTVKVGTVTLKKDTDYTLGYGNNTNAGTATITITGKGNYTGTKQVKFTIVKPAVTKTPAVITCFNKTYNGSTQTIATCSGGTIKNATQSATANYVVTCTGDSTHTNAANQTCKISPASIANTTISNVASQKYTGKAITPSITVTANGKTLTLGTDYVVGYTNNVKEGTATITVTGKGNYTGTKQKTFTITKEKTKATITCSNKVYSGTAQTIATCSGGTIKNASQTNVGSYTVTCTGDSSHTNADNKTCSITKGNVADATLVNAIANQTYTGKPITPNPTLSIKNKTLIKDKDYTLAYKNNTNAGTATITISGIGNYTGTKSIAFKIVSPAVITCANKTYNGSQQTIASCNGGTVKNAVQTSAGNYTITCTGDSSHTNATNKTCSIVKGKIENTTIAAIANQTYTGKAITPLPTVKLGTVTLKKDTDYTVTYSNNTNNGATATVKITGKGNYEGTKSATFKITSRATITCANKAYNGAAQTIATCSGGTISNASQTKVGSYTVSCTGDSTHSNAANQTCKITKANVSSVTIADIPSQIYTGKAITPTLTVKQGSKVLVKGTDYTVTYANNTAKGTKTASATITGIGNYEGTKTVKFSIVGSVEKITLNTTTLKLETNKTSKLTATISPADAIDSTLTWSTSNPIIASVDQQGNVKTISPGTATITAKSKNGKTATCTITVTTTSKTEAKYDSTTLKYWIERPSGAHYVVTHIWVEDAKSQMKVALTTPKTAGTNYPREIQIGGTIINNEIKNKGYQNKGLVAVNASPMNDGNLVKKSPVKWRGTQDIALVMNGGKVIRNSVNITLSSSELTSTEKSNYNYNNYSSLSSYNSSDKMLSTFGRYVYFLDKSTGKLNYRWFNNPFLYGNSKWISDRNAKYEKDKETTRLKDTSYYLNANTNNANYVIKNADYTFGFSPLLVTNGKSTNPDSSKKANRQALCQIDEHNFILITSHLDGKSSESNSDSSSKYFCGPLINGKCPRVAWGLTYNDLSNIMIRYGCITGVNLDGGGSTTFYYKNTKGTSTATRLNIQKENRGLADMLYFVEK